MAPRHLEAPLRRSPEPAQWPKPAAILVQPAQSLRPAVILVEPAQSPKSAARQTASLVSADTGGATADRGHDQSEGTVVVVDDDIIINRDSTCVREYTLPQSRYCISV